MLTWFQGCDLAGYNSDGFDIPILSEEFQRAGISYPSQDVNFIDVMKIERKVNANTLSAAYQRYTGEELDGAHDAMIDIEATKIVFFKQLEKYPDLPRTTKEIENLLSDGKNRVDIAGKLYESEGTVYWNFGKHKDKPIKDTKDYCNWVLKRALLHE